MIGAIPAGVSAASWLSNIAATGLPWAAQAASGAAQAVPTFMTPAANWALPFINPATAAAGAAEVGAGAATAAEVGVAAGASSAAGAGGAAGGGALAALGPVAAVVGSGLAGLAAGWGAASLIDDHKGGVFGQDEWGQDMSAFDAAAAIGRDTDKAVERGLGGGFIESMVGADAIDTVGDVAGAGMTAVTSIPAAAIGAVDSIYSFFAD
jgi:hypothetical protein